MTPTHVQFQGLTVFSGKRLYDKRSTRHSETLYGLFSIEADTLLPKLK